MVEAPAGVANKTTREVWTLDAMGNEIERKTYLYNGIDYALVQTDLKSFDDEGRQLSHSRNGRLLESATYANSKRVSHTDEQGSPPYLLTIRAIVCARAPRSAWLANQIK